jgi:ethanolamine utilization protein EutQ (cupin superfamily)
MPELIERPSRVEAAGTRPKLIDEYAVVLEGCLRVESQDAAPLDVRAGQAVLVRGGEWVRYSTPESGGASYVAVCLPAFGPQAVHRDDD